MAIIEIKHEDVVLARHIPEVDAWGEGLRFFSPPGDYQQAGTWGYHQGKHLMAHIHNEVSREVRLTQEVLYIRRGKILAEIYDSTERKVAELVACAGDILILLHGGHGYHIMEDGTQVLEIKNGPYLGADVDRRRI